MSLFDDKTRFDVYEQLVAPPISSESERLEIRVLEWSQVRILT